MPMPVSEALVSQGDAAVVKGEQVRSSPLKYLANSMLAGAYVGIAVVLMIMVSAAFIKASSPATKLVQGAVFGIALTLVVFAGAELFTGNVMVMLQGLWARKVNPFEVLMVWVGSLVGNLIGALAFSALVAASGVINLPHPKGQETLMTAALAGIIKGKVALSGSELFFRSVLCNMLVCLAIWMAVRAVTDGAKLLCLWWALLAFVASGFEHSIANMTVFGVGLFTHVDGATAAHLTRNLLWTVPGNIVGGGLLVGLAYSWIGSSKQASPASVDARVPVTAVAAEVSSPLVAKLDPDPAAVAEPVPAQVPARPLRARKTTAAPRRSTPSIDV